MNICRHVKFTKIKHPNGSNSKYIVGSTMKLPMNPNTKLISKHHSPVVLLMFGGMQIQDISNMPQISNDN